MCPNADVWIKIKINHGKTNSISFPMKKVQWEKKMHFLASFCLNFECLVLPPVVFVYRHFMREMVYKKMGKTVQRLWRLITNRVIYCGCQYIFNQRPTSYLWMDQTKQPSVAYHWLFILNGPEYEIINLSR